MHFKSFSKKTLTHLVIISSLCLTMFSPAIPVEASEELTQATATNNKNLSITFEEEIPAGYKLLESKNSNGSIDIWHYSGSYWKLGNEIVHDSQIKNGDIRNLETSFKTLTNGTTRSVLYPQAVKDKLAKGKKILVQVKARKDIESKYGISISELTRNTDKPELMQLKDNTSGLVHKEFFKFNFQESSTERIVFHQDFGLQTKTAIPFVREGFGNNGYSMYTVGGKTLKGTFTPWLGDKELPISIINKNGDLKPGHSVKLVDGSRYPSESIRVGQSAGVFNSGGAMGLNFEYFYEYSFYEEGAEIVEDVILTEMHLFDKETGKKVASFERSLDYEDPLNPANQKITATSTGPLDAFVMSRDKDYIVKAKYQFISFLEGPVDIRNTESMNQKQKNLNTAIDKNKLTKAEAFDGNAFKDNIFDKKEDINGDKNSLMRIFNLREETFTWDFKVSDGIKEHVKIAGFIPEGFFPIEKNQNPLNDWGALFGKIEQNDMALANLRLYDEAGHEVTTFEKGKKYTTNVAAKHQSGKDTIGDNATTNPKPIIKYKVTDPKKVVMPESPKQTSVVLNPKESLEVPKSNQFSTDENVIRVCATIDAIHHKLGYNENDSNDTICKDFKLSSGRNDIGLSDLKLYDSSGKEVDFIEPNKMYTTDVVANHLNGNEPIGLDATKNPKTKVIYDVVEAGNVSVLNDNPKQTDKILSPQSKVQMPKSNQFSSSDGFIKVCAEVDTSHATLGFNYDLSNDIICREFGMIKNYSVISLESNPSSINFSKNTSSLNNHPVNLIFKIGNETNRGASTTLPSSVPVVIKYKGTIIWNQNVSVIPGEAKEFSVGVPVTLVQGDNSFTVEVNPSRAQKEFKPGVSDPYLDNKKELNIRGTIYQECQTCLISGKRTTNDWVEEWRWEEQRGTVKSSTYYKCHKYKTEKYEKCSRRGKGGRCLKYKTYSRQVCVNSEDVPYKYCSVNYSKRWTERKSYTEEYKINKVEFGSKLNEDTQGKRMANISNGGKAKIKAGYGFELEIETIYKTNRGVAPLPNPYKGNSYKGDKYGKYSGGYCDFITRFPGVTPINAPKYIYVEMPYGDISGKGVCYILSDYADKGSWDNLSRTFMLPKRKSPTGEEQRRIYTNTNAQPNNTSSGEKSLPINIITPRPDKPDKFYGYNPENQIGNGKNSNSYLHDCYTIHVVIYPGDDIKSHIIQ